MPKYRVQVAQNACIMWYADIEATGKEHAAEQAMAAWNGRRDDIEFREGDAVGHDGATCDPEDCDLIEDEPIGAITPEGERLNQWDERLRASGCTPVYETKEQSVRMRFRPGMTLDDLTDVYNTWMRTNGLDLGSADEHLFDENLTDDQREWLKQFYERWQQEVG